MKKKEIENLLFKHNVLNKLAKKEKNMFTDCKRIPKYVDVKLRSPAHSEDKETLISSQTTDSKSLGEIPKIWTGHKIGLRWMEDIHSIKDIEFIPLSEVNTNDILYLEELKSHNETLDKLKKYMDECLKLMQDKEKLLDQISSSIPLSEVEKLRDDVMKIVKWELLEIHGCTTAKDKINSKFDSILQGRDRK